MNRIYFDNASTSFPKPPAVMEAMVRFANRCGTSPVGGGRTIDLVATRDGKRIAFEIETGTSDAAANIRKCLSAGVDRVVAVTTSRKVKGHQQRKYASSNKHSHPSITEKDFVRIVGWQGLRAEPSSSTVLLLDPALPLPERARTRGSPLKGPEFLYSAWHVGVRSGPYS